MFAKAMADLSDQKFQISVYGPGEIVPAFQVVDAVAEGATLSAFARFAEREAAGQEARHPIHVAMASAIGY